MEYTEPTLLLSSLLQQASSVPANTYSVVSAGKQALANLIGVLTVAHSAADVRQTTLLVSDHLYALEADRRSGLAVTAAVQMYRTAIERVDDSSRTLRIPSGVLDSAILSAGLLMMLLQKQVELSGAQAYLAKERAVSIVNDLAALGRVIAAQFDGSSPSAKTLGASLSWRRRTMCRAASGQNAAAWGTRVDAQALSRMLLQEPDSMRPKIAVVLTDALERDAQSRTFFLTACEMYERFEAAAREVLEETPLGGEDAFDCRMQRVCMQLQLFLVIMYTQAANRAAVRPNTDCAQRSTALAPHSACCQTPPARLWVPFHSERLRARKECQTRNARYAKAGVFAGVKLPPPALKQPKQSIATGVQDTAPIPTTASSEAGAILRMKDLRTMRYTQTGVKPPDTSEQAVPPIPASLQRLNSLVDEWRKSPTNKPPETSVSPVGGIPTLAAADVVFLPGRIALGMQILQHHASVRKAKKLQTLLPAPNINFLTGCMLAGNLMHPGLLYASAYIAYRTVTNLAREAKPTPKPHVWVKVATIIEELVTYYRDVEASGTGATNVYAMYKDVVNPKLTHQCLDSLHSHVNGRATNTTSDDELSNIVLTMVKNVRTTTKPVKDLLPFERILLLGILAWVAAETGFSKTKPFPPYDPENNFPYTNGPDLAVLLADPTNRNITTQPMSKIHDILALDRARAYAAHVWVMNLCDILAQPPMEQTLRGYDILPEFGVSSTDASSTNQAFAEARTVAHEIYSLLSGTTPPDPQALAGRLYPSLLAYASAVILTALTNTDYLARNGGAPEEFEEHNILHSALLNLNGVWTTSKGIKPHEDKNALVSTLALSKLQRVSLLVLYPMLEVGSHAFTESTAHQDLQTRAANAKDMVRNTLVAPMANSLYNAATMGGILVCAHLPPGEGLGQPYPQHTDVLSRQPVGEAQTTAVDEQARVRASCLLFILAVAGEQSVFATGNTSVTTSVQSPPPNQQPGRYLMDLVTLVGSMGAVIRTTNSIRTELTPAQHTYADSKWPADDNHTIVIKNLAHMLRNCIASSKETKNTNPAADAATLIELIEPFRAGRFAPTLRQKYDAEGAYFSYTETHSMRRAFTGHYLGMIRSAVGLMVDVGGAVQNARLRLTSAVEEGGMSNAIASVGMICCSAALYVAWQAFSPETAEDSSVLALVPLTPLFTLGNAAVQNLFQSTVALSGLEQEIVPHCYEVTTYTPTTSGSDMRVFYKNATRALSPFVVWHDMHNLTLNGTQVYMQRVINACNRYKNARTLPVFDQNPLPHVIVRTIMTGLGAITSASVETITGAVVAALTAAVLASVAIKEGRVRGLTRYQGVTAVRTLVTPDMRSRVLTDTIARVQKLFPNLPGGVSGPNPTEAELKLIYEEGLAHAVGRPLTASRPFFPHLNPQADAVAKLGASDTMANVFANKLVEHVPELLNLQTKDSGRRVTPFVAERMLDQSYYLFRSYLADGSNGSYRAAVEYIRQKDANAAVTMPIEIETMYQHVMKGLSADVFGGEGTAYADLNEASRMLLAYGSTWKSNLEKAKTIEALNVELSAASHGVTVARENVLAQQTALRGIQTEYSTDDVQKENARYEEAIKLLDADFASKKVDIQETRRHKIEDATAILKAAEATALSEWRIEHPNPKSTDEARLKTLRTTEETRALKQIQDNMDIVYDNLDKTLARGQSEYIAWIRPKVVEVVPVDPGDSLLPLFSRFGRSMATFLTGGPSQAVADPTAFISYAYKWNNVSMHFPVTHYPEDIFVDSYIQIGSEGISPDAELRTYNFATPRNVHGTVMGVCKAAIEHARNEKSVSISTVAGALTDLMEKIYSRTGALSQLPQHLQVLQQIARNTSDTGVEITTNASIPEEMHELTDLIRLPYAKQRCQTLLAILKASGTVKDDKWTPYGFQHTSTLYHNIIAPVEEMCHTNTAAQYAVNIAMEIETADVTPLLEGPLTGFGYPGSLSTTAPLTDPRIKLAVSFVNSRKNTHVVMRAPKFYAGFDHQSQITKKIATETTGEESAATLAHSLAETTKKKALETIRNNAIAEVRDATNKTANSSIGRARTDLTTKKLEAKEFHDNEIRRISRSFSPEYLRLQQALLDVTDIWAATNRTYTEFFAKIANTAYSVPTDVDAASQFFNRDVRGGDVALAVRVTPTQSTFGNAAASPYAGRMVQVLAGAAVCAALHQMRNTPKRSARVLVGILSAARISMHVIGGRGYAYVALGTSAADELWNGHSTLGQEGIFTRSLVEAALSRMYVGRQMMLEMGADLASFSGQGADQIVLRINELAVLTLAAGFLVERGFCRFPVAQAFMATAVLGRAVRRSLNGVVFRGPSLQGEGRMWSIAQYSARSLRAAQPSWTRDAKEVRTLFTQFLEQNVSSDHIVNVLTAMAVEAVLLTADSSVYVGTVLAQLTVLEAMGMGRRVSQTLDSILALCASGQGAPTATVGVASAGVTPSTNTPAALQSGAIARGKLLRGIARMAALVAFQTVGTLGMLAITYSDQVPSLAGSPNVIALMLQQRRDTTGLHLTLFPAMFEGQVYINALVWAELVTTAARKLNPEHMNDITRRNFRDLIFTGVLGVASVWSLVASVGLTGQGLAILQGMRRFADIGVTAFSYGTPGLLGDIPWRPPAWDFGSALRMLFLPGPVGLIPAALDVGLGTILGPNTPLSTFLTQYSLSAITAQATRAIVNFPTKFPSEAARVFGVFAYLAQGITRSVQGTATEASWMHLLAGYGSVGVGVIAVLYILAKFIKREVIYLESGEAQPDPKYRPWLANTYTTMTRGVVGGTLVTGFLGVIASIALTLAAEVGVEITNPEDYSQLPAYFVSVILNMLVLKLITLVGQFATGWADL